MSKEHQSAGLRWSLLLRGSSFGGHGSFLGLFSSSFVFLIISCHIWSCGRWFCCGVYRDRWVMRRTSSLPAIMVFGDLYFSLGKSFSFMPWALRWGRKEEKASRGGGAFPSSFLNWPGEWFFLSFGLFWWTPPHCSWNVFEVGWAGMCLGLNWWPNAITSCFQPR